MTPTLALDLRAGLWIVWVRVSDQKQEVERQHAATRTIIERWNLQDRIYKTIELKHVSGRWVMVDPEAQRVIEEDLNKPEILGIIIDDQDRLFRMDRFGSMGILDHFKEHGKLILTPDGVLDLRTDSGFMSAAMKGVISAIDWRKIRRLCNNGKEEKRKQKIHPNGEHTIARGVLCEKI